METVFQSPPVVLRKTSILWEFSRYKENAVLSYTLKSMQMCTNHWTVSLPLLQKCDIYIFQWKN